jgi:hypothetical protein
MRNTDRRQSEEDKKVDLQLDYADLKRLIGIVGMTVAVPEYRDRWSTEKSEQDKVEELWDSLRAKL